MKFISNIAIVVLLILISGFSRAQNPDYLTAKSLFEKEDYKEAIRYYTKSLEKDTDYRTLMGRAQVYIKLKKYEPAIEDYNEAIELNPEDSRIFNNRGNCFLEMNEEQAAFADFNQAIHLDPANYHAYNSRGYIYFSKDSLKKAEEDFIRAMSLSLNYRLAYINLADLYVQQGKNDVALELIIEYLQHNKDDFVALSYLGEFYQLQENFDLAAKFYFTSLNIERNQIEIGENLALLLVEKLNDFDHAIEFISGYVDDYPSDLLNYLLGMSYLAKENYYRALPLFEKVRSANKEGFQNSSILIVTCLAELTKYSEALNMLDSLESKQYKLAEVYLQKSLIYSKIEEEKKALKYLEEAIKINPKTNLYLQKAYLLNKLGKPKKALEIYRLMDSSVVYKLDVLELKASLFLELKEKDSACSCLYQSVLLGKYEKANSYLQSCGNSLDSNRTKVLQVLNLMNIYRKKGQVFRDQNDFNTLIELEPDVFDFYLWRGIYHKSKKEYSLAIEDFSKCVEIAPDRFEGYFFSSNSMLENGDSSAYLTTISLGFFKTKSVELLYSRALFYKRIKDTEYAFKDLKEIITLSPNYSNAYYQIGLLFVESKESEKACKYLKQALILGNSKAKLEYRISCQ